MFVPMLPLWQHIGGQSIILSAGNFILVQEFYFGHFLK